MRVRGFQFHEPRIQSRFRPALNTHVTVVRASPSSFVLLLVSSLFSPFPSQLIRSCASHTNKQTARLHTPVAPTVTSTNIVQVFVSHFCASICFTWDPPVEQVMDRLDRCVLSNFHLQVHPTGVIILQYHTTTSSLKRVNIYFRI